MTDSELQALAAMVQMEAVLMAGENKERERHGKSIVYVDNCHSFAYISLEAEMRKRGVFK